MPPQQYELPAPQTPSDPFLGRQVDPHSVLRQGQPEIPPVGEPADDPPANALRIPIAGSQPSDAIKISGTGNRVTLVVRDAPLSDVLSLLAESRDLNIVFNDSLTERVSITLNNRPLTDALTSILAVAGYRWSESRGIIHVIRINQTDVPAEVQGCHLQVFELDYIAASDLLEGVQRFLSPAGKVSVLKSSSSDNMRTRESLIVEDVPEVIARVTDYVAQLDQPPRQVLIQVHVLQVELKDELKHGVNLDALMKIGNIDVDFSTVGMANPDSPTGSFLSLTGPDLTTLIECLQTTTDAKTIASPRVLCLNGQESRIQVGEQLGFRVTTTTETSTLQSVEFLDVGVVLNVTPRISRDGQVVIHIRPEVSSGRVNPVTGLPEENTTFVETNVRLTSGHAFVIGGLIKENITDNQSKVPKLGDVYRVGKLFQRREYTKQRDEIIIALVPYVLPYDPYNAVRNCQGVNQSASPLMAGPLMPVPRPWEARLPNAYDRPLRLPPIEGDGCCILNGPPTDYSYGDYRLPYEPMPCAPYNCGPSCESPHCGPMGMPAPRLEEVPRGVPLEAAPAPAPTPAAPQARRQFSHSRLPNGAPRTR